MTVAAVGFFVLLIADILKYRKTDTLKRFLQLPLAVRWLILYAAIISILIFGIYGPEFDASTFIYFQF